MYKMMCVVSQDTLKKGKLLRAQQDGSREFISLLAYISAAKKCLSPLLIYKGESHDIMDTWLEDFGKEDKAWFASTSNGWSCDKIGMLWFKQLFDHYTKVPRAQR